MARPLRFQYPGAVYHVMARGDGGKQVFETPADHRVFLARLGETCVSHGWRVHAWVLMGNHFHLLVETPQPNLVAGMKWLLGTFSQGWNRARQRRGHVFQGRYKSVPVSGTDSDAHYFRSVADYIHLNPARAGLAGGERGPLVGYPWSSLPLHEQGTGPEWLVLDRVLSAFELAHDGRGRRAYVDWLEARAANAAGKIDETAMAALRRGWFLGDESFRGRLLGLLENAGKSEIRTRKPPEGGLRDHGVRDAERLLIEGTAALGLPAEASALADLRKGDPRKVVLATLIRRHTGVGTEWLAERLHMGHPGSVSRLLGTLRNQPKLAQNLEKLEKMLICGD